MCKAKHLARLRILIWIGSWVICRYRDFSRTEIRFQRTKTHSRWSCFRYTCGNAAFIKFVSNFMLLTVHLHWITFYHVWLCNFFAGFSHMYTESRAVRPIRANIWEESACREGLLRLLFYYLLFLLLWVDMLVLPSGRAPIRLDLHMEWYTLQKKEKPP